MDQTGFTTLKDVLQVLIIPIVLFLLGIAIPRLLERQRRIAFVTLIRREFDEMEPDDPAAWLEKSDVRWTSHLRKRFIHEEIFHNVSQNRDFILSLDPDLAYHMAQLWINFKKAEDAENAEEVKYYGNEWCYFLYKVCQWLDGKRGADHELESARFTNDNRKNDYFCRKIYKAWEELIKPTENGEPLKRSCQ